MQHCCWQIIYVRCGCTSRNLTLNRFRIKSHQWIKISASLPMKTSRSFWDANTHVCLCVILLNKAWRVGLSIFATVAAQQMMHHVSKHTTMDRLVSHTRTNNGCLGSDSRLALVSNTKSVCGVTTETNNSWIHLNRFLEWLLQSFRFKTLNIHVVKNQTESQMPSLNLSQSICAE